MEQRLFVWEDFYSVNIVFINSIHFIKFYFTAGNLLEIVFLIILGIKNIQKCLLIALTLRCVEQTAWKEDQAT